MRKSTRTYSSRRRETRLSSSKNDDQLEEETQKQPLKKTKSVKETRGETAKRSFPLGSVVLAKMDSYPWWPGMIISEEYLPKNMSKKPRGACLPVQFFPDNDCGWVKLSALQNLTPEMVSEALGNKRKLLEGLRPAKLQKQLVQGYEVALDPPRFDESDESVDDMDEEDEEDENEVKDEDVSSMDEFSESSVSETKESSVDETEGRQSKRLRDASTHISPPHKQTTKDTAPTKTTEDAPEPKLRSSKRLRGHAMPSMAEPSSSDEDDLLESSENTVYDEERDDDSDASSVTSMESIESLSEMYDEAEPSNSAANAEDTDVPKVARRSRRRFVKKKPHSIYQPRNKQAMTKEELAEFPKRHASVISELLADHTREQRILFLRHKLQNCFLRPLHEPTMAEVINCRLYLAALSEFPGMNWDLIQATKIAKVLSRILQLETIPFDEKDIIRNKCSHLLNTQWISLLSESRNKSPTATKTRTRTKSKRSRNPQNKFEVSIGPIETTLDAKSNGNSSSTT
ncbi:PWWP domain-containing protein Pdp1 [Schizosaccharomyces japonicus yFS275]|uniref:PWWP domain-containing protein Pdp1 n=1 Tax=Schizosaccharomyces japonicus (strain yFS275 / FY16936) TaxID=402676 RepID=B6JVY0_SCHJY|nr:PWWP domain-containing protein Pdp1 [Schizosaccharomyces japonicus yFS275]EEB05531.2 PWWP domain-containing protein Pdp1 [Schizosaccharomyces japonicus yFS275]